MTLSRKRTYLARTVTSSHLIFFVRAVVLEASLFFWLTAMVYCFTASTTKRRVFALFWPITACFATVNPNMKITKTVIQRFLLRALVDSISRCWLNPNDHTLNVWRNNCIANLYEVSSWYYSFTLRNPNLFRSYLPDIMLVYMSYVPHWNSVLSVCLN